MSRASAWRARAWSAGAALAALALVHRGALAVRLSGLDRARAVAPDGDELAPLGVESLLWRLESTLLGADDRGYALVGLALLAVSALLVAEATRALLRAASTRTAAAAGNEPVLGPAVAAALWAGSPLLGDAVTTLPGHAMLIGMGLVAGLTALATSRASLSTLALAPLLGSLLLGNTVGAAFFLAPLLVVGVRGRARGEAPSAASVPPRAIAGVLLALVAVVAWSLVFGFAAEHARDLGDDAGPLARIGRLASATLVPVARLDLMPAGATWAHVASFAGAALALVALGSIGRRDEGAGARRLARVALIATVCGVALAAAGPALAPSLADARILAPALFGFVLMLGSCAEAVARSGTRDVLAIALASFLVWSGANAAARLREVRDHEVFPPEWRAIVDAVAAQKTRLARDFDRVILLGCDGDLDRVAWARALPATFRAPWTDTPIALEAAPEDAYEHLPDALFRSGERTLVCEWRPSSVMRAGGRPDGWILAPLVVAPREARFDASDLALLAPGPDQEIALRAPRTIEEDMTFTFETGPGGEPRAGELFVFYGFFSGGWNPKGRDQIAVRPLLPSVLGRKDVGGGRTRWSWRPSIRPEPGHPGVLFEDPDLEIAGSSFHWTVGVAPSGGDEAFYAADEHDHAAHGHDDHDHEDHDQEDRDGHGHGENPAGDHDGEFGHAGHVHDRDPALLRFPRLLAQTRRVRFTAPSDGSGAPAETISKDG